MRIKVRSLLRYLTIIHIKFIFAINFKTVSKNADEAQRIHFFITTCKNPLH